MATMADVARAAGVSRTTVSLVLNHRGGEVGIAQATRERVFEAAKRLGYRLGQPLAASVGPPPAGFVLWTAALATEADARCVAAVVDEAQRQGQTVQLVVGEAGRKVVKAGPAGVLGWALAPADRGWLSERSARHHLPVALIDPPHGGEELRPAIEHLFGLGHRKLGLVAWPREPELENGFAQGVAGLWLPFGEQAVLRVDGGLDDARELVRDWLKSRKSRPTAVLCTSDEAALLVVRLARRLELKVPRELSVVGYGNSPWGALVEPALTTLASPLESRARGAVLTLLGLVPAPPASPTLVVRKSTAAVQ